MQVSRFARLMGGLTLSAITMAASAAEVTYNWTQVTRFKEDARLEASGVVVYVREGGKAKSFDIRPHQMTRTLFPGAIVGDGRNQATSHQLWNALLDSPLVIGNSSRLVRARDVMEDWDINFVNPQEPGKNYWFDFYADNVARGVWVSYAHSIANGPQKGEVVIGNQKLLAMGDDRSAWLDNDGSLSFYWRGSGLLDMDSTATRFAGGPEGWNSAALTSKLSNLIGYEEGRLYFLEGDRLLHVYDRQLKHLRTDELHLNGELIDHSLGEVIDGKVPGVRYVGWDLGPVLVFTDGQP